ncbi:MAG: NUDIX domain-containing protein [Anaerolineales bacterium]|nr:NUDIX domain-containing protein [Anaerolineales bacterium]
MLIISSEFDIELLPKPNEYHLILDDTLPPVELITAVFGLIFDGNQFLMTNLVERGWDIPGGHTESGESPEQTVRREIFEETHALVRDLHVLGYDKFMIQAPKPDAYSYPYPVSYQLFYWGRVNRLEPFVATSEAVGRKLFTPEAARQTDWVKRSPALYEAALNQVVST